MKALSFSQLDTSLLKTFATLGIYSAKDLAQLPIEQVWDDLTKLGEYLPDYQHALSFTLLREIHKAACSEAADELEIDDSAPLPKKSIEEPVIKEQIPTPVMDEPSLQEEPELPTEDAIEYKKLRPSTRPEVSYIEQSRRANIQDRANAMRCRKSTSLFFTALITCILTPGLIAVAALTCYSIITNQEVVMYGIIAISYLVIYIIFIILRLKIKCQVCRIRTFTLRDYPHNKHAHNWLFFGYNLSTSLHIIFTLWFRCPACGTAVRLFKPKRHS